jgi:hypothetical protein
MSVTDKYWEDEVGNIYIPIAGLRVYIKGTPKEELLRRGTAYALMDSLRVHGLYWDNGALHYIKKFCKKTYKELNQTIYEFNDGSAFVDSVFLRRISPPGYKIRECTRSVMK